MLKSTQMMKRADIRAVDAVRDLLGNVAGVEIESVDFERHVGPTYHVDAWIGLTYPGGSYGLVVDVKPNGAPRHVRSGVLNRAGHSGDRSG